MNIGSLVFWVLVAAIALGEYMTCRFVASRRGPIHLWLAWVMILFFFPVGMFGAIQGWYVRELREIEGGGHTPRRETFGYERFAKSTHR